MAVLTDGQEFSPIGSDAENGIRDEWRLIWVGTAYRADAWKGWVNPPHDFDKYDGIKKGGDKG